MPKEGELLAGTYRVEGIVGVGSMGMVIAARHEHLDARVALKTLLPRAARTAEVRRRFQREARAAFKLQNEHVCRVLDAGVLEDGSLFMAMELLVGETLAEVLSRHGRLPMEKALDYVIQACEGIGAAHDIGIIHRDIKPANLFLTSRRDGTDCVKVIDFGISKVKVDSHFTNAGAFLGSPIYAAPEQLESARDVTPASDVWALGVVLHQLLLGSYPFEGNLSTLDGVLYAVMNGPVRPSERDPSFPRELEDALMSALETDPRKRCPNARAFARLLRACVGGASRPRWQDEPEPATRRIPPPWGPLPMAAPTPRPSYPFVQPDFGVVATRASASAVRVVRPAHVAFTLVMLALGMLLMAIAALELHHAKTRRASTEPSPASYVTRS